jgi:hypothetical protein
MGFKSFLSRAVGGFGTVLKKIGDFGSGAARKIGEFAPGVASAAGGIADMLGQGGIASAIRSVGDKIAQYSPQVQSILSKVGSVGQTVQS